MNFPIPKHKGILISNGVSKNFKIHEIKKKLVEVNLFEGFEEVQKHVKIKLLESISTDTLWLLKLKLEDQLYLALSLGSEM